MRCPHCGREFGPPRVAYCSRRCSKNASGMRLYYFRKTHQPDVAGAKAERRRIYALAWRRRMAEEGRCTRCGAEDDRGEEGRLVCSSCLMKLKGVL